MFFNEGEKSHKGDTECTVKTNYPEDLTRLRQHPAKLPSVFNTFLIPYGLAPEEKEVYKKLLDVAQARKASNVQAPRVTTITDLAKDFDDMMALLILKELQRLGLVDLGFIANLTPPRKRALYGRGALDSLGLETVPIGVGTEATTVPRDVYDYEFEASFMPDEETFVPNKDNFFEDGFELLDRVFTQAIEGKRQVTLLLISPLTDINQYAEAKPKVFQDIVARVYMQGGYPVSEEGILIPRDDAANNFLDPPAAEGFHKRLQIIPSDVYTRVAVYATEISAEVFKELAATQHPIGEDLLYRYKRQGVAFYKKACSPKPFKDLNQRRFLDTYSTFYRKHPPGVLCDRNGTPLAEDGTLLPIGDEIIPYLTIALAYDALPALASGGDDVLKALNVLDTNSMANQTSIHRVVGTPKL